MPIPDFQTLMLPVLAAAGSADGEVRIRDVERALADQWNLTDEEREQLIPSGRQPVFYNRVHWAKSYLGKGGLIELTRRGYFKITEQGRSVLASPPSRIDLRFLKQIPEFASAHLAKDSVPQTSPVNSASHDEVLTPDELMRKARDQLDSDLGSELLARIWAAPPAFFERLVVQLLTSMGYGGSVAKAGRALGRSGDGGVDGVIDEDALGLDRIYVQAKRYADTNSVGSSEIRDFFGALDQVKANKGLFVTTSYFTPSAMRTVEGLSKRIVLVDGGQLTKLMIDHGVGCRTQDTLYIKQIDEEFFDTSF